MQKDGFEPANRWLLLWLIFQIINMETEGQAVPKWSDAMTPLPSSRTKNNVYFQSTKVAFVFCVNFYS